MLNPILFKFALAALLTLYPTAKTGKTDAPMVEITEMTPDAEVLRYCWKPLDTNQQTSQLRRVCRLAQEISDVVEQHAVEDHIPFRGPKGREATVLALEGIAFHESGLRASVEKCTVTGDLPYKQAPMSIGRSISMYQLMAGPSRQDLYITEGFLAGTKVPSPKRYSRDAICSDNKLATKLSLHVMMRFPKYPASMFYSYAGNGGKKSKAGEELYQQFNSLMLRQGLKLVSHQHPMWVDATTPKAEPKEEIRVELVRNDI